MPKSTDAIQLDKEECKRVRDIIVSDLTIARGETDRRIKILNEFRRAYEVVTKRKPLFRGAPSITIPFIKSSTTTLEAAIFPTLLNPVPLINVDVIGQDPLDIAGMWQDYYQELHTKITPYRDAWKKAIHYGLRDGSAVLMSTQYTKKEMIWRSDDKLAVNNGKASYGNPVRSEKTIYDYPRLDVFPIERFIALPSDNFDMQETPGVGVHIRVYGHDLRAGAAAGYYDKEKVEEALEENQWLGRLSADDKLQFIDGPAQYQTDGGRPDEKTPEGEHPEYDRQPFWITELYYRYTPPGKTVSENWLFTLQHHKILRAQPDPWWGVRRRFTIMRPYSVDDSPYGESVPSLGGLEAQNGMSDMASLLIAMGMRQVNPRFAVPKSLWKFLKEEFDKPENKEMAAFLACPESMFESGSPGLKSMEMGASANTLLPSLEFLDQLAQGFNGVNDAAKGNQTTGGITATESLAMQEGSKQLESHIIENIGDSMAKVQACEHELTIQFADRPMPNTLWNQVTGGKIPLEMAVKREIFFTANGSFATSRSIQAKLAQEAAALLMPMPEIQSDPAARWNIVHNVLQKSGIKQPETLMGSSDEWQQKFQQHQQMAQQAHQEELQIAMMRYGPKQPEAPRNPEDIANEHAAMAFGHTLGENTAHNVAPMPEAPSASQTADLAKVANIPTALEKPNG